VLGRLPVRYRTWIAVAGVLTFALAGAWVGYVVQVTPSWPAMTALGTAVGAVAVAALHVRPASRVVTARLRVR
jgi:hypothetical protein